MKIQVFVATFHANFAKDAFKVGLFVILHGHVCDFIHFECKRYFVLISASSSRPLTLKEAAASERTQQQQKQV